MSMKAISELCLSDILRVLVGIGLCIPLVRYRFGELMRSEQDIFPIIALCNLKLLLHSLQLIVCISLVLINSANMFYSGRGACIGAGAYCRVAMVRVMPCRICIYIINSCSMLTYGCGGGFGSCWLTLLLLLLALALALPVFLFE